MRNLLLLFLATFFLNACATRPIPTATLPQPSPTAKPTLTPTATRTAFPTTTPTWTPVPTTTATPTITPTPIAFDRNPRALLIDADAFAPNLSRDTHVPLFRLYADGFVVFAGERTATATGLDAVVRLGQLSDGAVQNLLAYIYQAGFFDLPEYTEPRPKPADGTLMQIRIYLTKTKTVRMLTANDDDTPTIFADVFKRIIQSIPNDATTFTPTDAYFESTDVGATNSITAKEPFIDWTIADVKLADATNGITVSGKTYTQILALRANQPETALYRDGNRAYRLRFAPNLPRAVRLTNWLGTILNAAREFDGRTFEIVGYYRGWNLLGEARGNPPVTRNDWVIADDSGAMYVTGLAPSGLSGGARDDVWNVVRLTARVVYVRLGTSYLEAKRVDNLTAKTPATPTPGNNSTESAIALVKQKFPEVANIKVSPPGMIGASTNITVVNLRQDAIYLVFWQGWGDCPAGCINNRYHYFIVKDGIATKAGEYTRVYNESKNDFDVSGSPMWGVPK